MIQTNTYLKVADNTGARKLMCICVLGSHESRVGDIIIAVVKDSLPNMSVKRTEIVTAVIVRTRKKTRRINGSQVCFDENSVVLLNKDKSPRGSRVFGPIARELRNKDFTKIFSLAPEIT